LRDFLKCFFIVTFLSDQKSVKTILQKMSCSIYLSIHKKKGSWIQQKNIKKLNCFQHWSKIWRTVYLL